MSILKSPVELGSLLTSDEKISAAIPRKQGAGDDRILISDSMAKRYVKAVCIMRGVPPHGLLLMVGWCVSPRGGFSRSSH